MEVLKLKNGVKLPAIKQPYGIPMNKSKTEQALALVDQGARPAEAARKMEISESAVYAAIKKRKTKALGRCHCCDAPIDANGKYVPRTGD